MTRFVSGEGPQPCRYMLVGEGPGAEEDKWGRPWVGKAGRELWRYLWRSCGLSRDDVYATNLVKYRVPDDGDPTPEDIARDAPLLREEVANVHPQVIVTLGRWSSRHFLGPVDMDWCHGVPHYVKGTVVVPVVHPAAGLHSTEFQGTIAWDFEQLGRLLRGDAVRWAAEDEHPEPEYREATGACGNGEQLLAVDTEGSAARPWCLSDCSHPGRASALRYGHGSFQAPGTFILHNAMHDLGVLRAMGIEGFNFHDTMIMAYLLCVEPQGLKALAKRHCGMEMSDYADIVREANLQHASDYLGEVVKWLVKRSTNGSSASSATTLPSRKRTSAPGGRRSSRTASRAKSSRR